MRQKLRLVKKPFRSISKQCDRLPFRFFLEIFYVIFQPIVTLLIWPLFYQFPCHYPLITYPKLYTKTQLLPPQNLCCSSETITNKSSELRVTKQKLHLLTNLFKSEFKDQIAFEMRQNAIILVAFQKELKVKLLDWNVNELENESVQVKMKPPQCSIHCFDTKWKIW